MAYNDDDDVLASPSLPEAFTRADGGKREALQRKIEADTGKELATEFGKLRSQADLQKLKTELKKDPNKKVDHKEQKTFGTKTMKQEEQEKVMGAKTKTTPERLQNQQETERQQQEAQSQEQQQNVD